MGPIASGGSRSDKKYPSISLSGIVLDKKYQPMDIFYLKKHQIS
jgi:hypothetical protein